MNPVDDALMGITHVLRGEDLLPSTPRQIALYEALIDIGRAEVSPTVRAPAVRHGGGQPQALQARPAVEPVPVPRRRVHHRGHGQLPGAAGLVARPRTGTSSRPPSSSPPSTGTRISGNPARFDRKKAEAINGAHLRLLDPGDFADRLERYLVASGRLPAEPDDAAGLALVRAAAPLVQERSALLSDAAAMMRLPASPPTSGSQSTRPPPRKVLTGRGARARGVDRVVEHIPGGAAGRDRRNSPPRRSRRR